MAAWGRGPAYLQGYVTFIPPFQVVEGPIPSLLLETEEHPLFSLQEASNINSYHLSSPC